MPPLSVAASCSSSGEASGVYYRQRCIMPPLSVAASEVETCGNDDSAYSLTCALPSVLVEDSGSIAQPAMTRLAVESEGFTYV
jgi:hypothetical protein